MTIGISFTRIGLMSNNIPTKSGYITREIEEKLGKLLRLPQIIALVGPRQAGKSTLLLHLKKKLSKAVYLSFENQKILDIFDQDIENFARLYLDGQTKYLILDEFHYAKQGGKNLKYLYDFFPGKKIIISGSSAPELTVKAIKYLVGRVVILNLYPFSFGEFLFAKDKKLYQIWKKKSADSLIRSPMGIKIQEFYEKYLIWGGYPQAVLEKDAELRKELLTNIYSIFLLREVKSFLGLTDDYKLKKLVKALALGAGTLVNYQELSQISGLDFKTLKRYLNFLEKTYIVKLVSPFFTNKRKELSKNPKIYFWDNGLRNSIIESFSLPEQRIDKGFILENAIFRNLAEKEAVKFWRTKSKLEVDFVMEKENKILPIEVKWNWQKNTPPLSLRNFCQAYKSKKAFILTFFVCFQTQAGETEILFRPAWKTGI